MTNLTVGYEEAHCFPFFKDGVAFAGTATAQAWVCNAATGAREYLQADDTLDPTAHNFTCTVSAGIAQVILAATSSMLGRIMVVQCTASDADFAPKSLNYFVVDDSAANPGDSLGTGDAIFETPQRV